MNASDPVNRVAAFLQEHGYKRLPSPLVINRMAFHFPAVLGGAEKSSDLILVADSVDTDSVEIVRQVLGVARALDVARSRNPLTTVIVGPRPGQDNLETMMEVCRVLPVGPIAGADGDNALSNWLAVLTPLDQIDTDGIVADPLTALKERVDDLPSEIGELINFAEDGSGAVEDELNTLLTRELNGAWDSDE